MVTYVLKIESPVIIPLEALEQIKQAVRNILTEYLKTQIYVEIVRQERTSRFEIFGTIFEV